MSTSPADFNARIIDEFHANDGRVGGMFEAMPLLLLHHTGAKSGKSRINPLAYQGDRERYVIFASKGGAPTNPDWYHNLKAQPDVTIEVGTETINVRRQRGDRRGPRASVPRAAERSPQFADYEEKTGRAIPVIVLTPTKTG